MRIVGARGIGDERAGRLAAGCCGRGPRGLGGGRERATHAAGRRQGGRAADALQDAYCAPECRADGRLRAQPRRAARRLALRARFLRHQPERDRHPQGKETWCALFTRVLRHTRTYSLSN